MKLKRVMAVIMSMIMIVLCIPAVSAAENIVFSFSSSVPSGNEVALGDVVTYTVSLDESSGFSFGTLFFAPSDNLSYVGATYKGNEVTAEKAVTGDNKDAYGIMIAGEPITGTDPAFCTIKFKVVNKGNTSVSLSVYELTDGNAFLTPSINNGTVTHSVKTPNAPEITTTSLPEAAVGSEYSYKIVGTNDELLTYSLEGTLPSGLTLDPDGTLHGIPTQAGTFSFVVKATLLGEFVSEGKTLTITVTDKPKALELQDQSGYVIDGEFLRGVVEKTKLSDILAKFKNAESIKVYNGSGKEVTDPSALIGTGYTVSLINGEEKVHTVTLIVLGDVSGNGRIDAMDYQRVRMYLFGTFKLEGAYLQAALVAKKANVTAMDFQRIKMHIFGTYNIYK